MKREKINKEPFNYVDFSKRIREWMDKEKRGVPDSKSWDEKERELGAGLNKIKRKLINPYLKLKTEEEKKAYEIEHPEIIEVLENLKELFYQKSAPVAVYPYLQHAIDIRDWMARKKTKVFPRQDSDDIEERKLARHFQNIKQRYYKRYLNLKSQEEREEFEKKHPDFNEIMKILESIGVKEIKKLNSKLENAREIRDWMEYNNNTRIPQILSDDIEERKLASAMIRIRRDLVEVYYEAVKRKEEELFRKRHSDIDEILEIFEKIDKIKSEYPQENGVAKSKYLRNAQLIKEWVEQKGRLPYRSSEDEKEIKFANALYTMRYEFVNPYLKLNTEEEKKAYEIKHPEIKEVMEILTWIKICSRPYFNYIKQVKEWLAEEKREILPDNKSNNTKEQEMAKLVSILKEKILRPYLKLKTEEEKREFERKFPEIIDVMDLIINSRTSKRHYYKDAVRVKRWMDEKKAKNVPSVKAKNQEEKEIGMLLFDLRRYLINPYFKLETDEAKKAYEKENPEIISVLEVFYEIYKNVEHKKQKVMTDNINNSLKSFVARNVGSNQEIRADLLEKIEEMAREENSLGEIDDD